LPKHAYAARTHVPCHQSGQEWRGTWPLDGKDVCVSSAFGSARVAKGRKPPADVAAETLKGLVDEWATRR
jgi:hypothetical protein